MAYDFLEDHALKNVWCAPYQDRQSRVQPFRLTGVSGVFNNVKVGWRWHQLPQSGVRFHVFNIGPIYPDLLGFAPTQYQWVNLADCCNQMKLIVDLYLDSGMELPRFEAWYMIDADKNIFLAVRDPRPNINVNLGRETLYFRVYTNAYFYGLRPDQRTDVIQVKGLRALDTAAILAMQTEYEALQAQPGQVYAFVNGFKVSSIDLITCKPGDVIEYVYDSTIFLVVDFNVSDLRTFDSTLDLKTKYLLHYAGLGDEQIDYQDDIDVWLMQPLANGRHKAIYVHRNDPATFRNVTHKDYSIAVQYLVALAQYQPDWTDLTQLQIRMHVRYGGMNRPLVDENNRIKELYKLPDDELRKSMLGIDSSVPNWRADVLEAAPYPALMRSQIPCLDKNTVEAAYGYNACSKLLGNTPSFTRVESEQVVCDVPYGLQSRSTGYEYDSNGYLLGYFNHQLGSIYPAKDQRAHLVELIAGQGDTELDEIYGQRTQLIDPASDYRMYTCPIVNGQPTNVWTDVTGSGLYAIVNGQLTWMVDSTKTYTLVRGNRRFLAYSLDIQPQFGVLQFTLVHRQRRGNTISYWTMQVPCGELTLWLNGKSLIEGVDYFVQFPKIVIVNKEYLINPQVDTQHIDIRFTGFCKSDLTHENTQDDFGFVTYQLLSKNKTYNVRDDKVLRIVAGGAFYDRSELHFSETDSGITTTDPINGKPYLIRDIVVPLRGYTNEDTYSMRAKSMVIDQRVSDRLSEFIPDPVIPSPPVIQELYALYSPFTCKLIYSLVTGVLDDPRMYGAYSSALVLELCKPYEDMLAFDPATQALRPDPKFTQVHPHNLMDVIDIDIYQYRFLSQAVKLYLGNAVELSHFLRIKDYQTEG